MISRSELPEEAWSHWVPVAPSSVRHLFESTDPAELTEVLDGLGLADAVTVIGKSDDLAALLREAQAAAAEVAGPYDPVLTGDASTVAALRRDVRQWPRPPEHTKARGNWAAGPTGLD